MGNLTHALFVKPYFLKPSVFVLLFLTQVPQHGTDLTVKYKIGTDLAPYDC